SLRAIAAVEGGITRCPRVADPGCGCVDDVVARLLRLQAEVESVHRGIVEVEAWIEREAPEDARPPGPVAFHDRNNTDRPSSLERRNVADMPAVPTDLSGICVNPAREPGVHDPPPRTHDVRLVEAREQSLEP